MLKLFKTASFVKPLTLKQGAFMFSTFALHDSQRIYVQKEQDHYLLDVDLPRGDTKRFYLNSSDSVGKLFKDIKEEI